MKKNQEQQNQKDSSTQEGYESTQLMKEQKLLRGSSLNIQPVGESSLNLRERRKLRYSSMLQVQSEDFAKITSTYMVRGTLDSDQLISVDKVDQEMSEKDQVLSEILKRNYIDLHREEESNLAVYVLRKVARNHLETEFLKKIISDIPLFKKNAEIASNCSNQIIMKVSHCFYRKNEVIFNYGDPGSVYYLILKGSVYCLVPNKEFKDQQLSEKPKKTEENLDPSKEQQKQKNQKLMRQQTLDKHQLPEFDVKNGQYQPPQSPLKKTKRSLRRNRSQSFSDNEDPSKNSPEKMDENRQLIAENYKEFDIVKELLQGEGFGEIAILTGEQRTATMICAQDTHLLALSKKSFETIVGAYKEHLMGEIISFLERFSFLKGMSQANLLSLWQFMKEEKYSSGNIIFSEKDKPTQIYFIKSGEIEISKNIVHSCDTNTSILSPELDQFQTFGLQQKQKAKQSVRLSLLGPNSYFGAQEVIKKTEFRETHAKCVSDSATVYSVDKKKFLLFLKVRSYFTGFKKEVKMKIQWEDERNKVLSAANMQFQQILTAAQTPSISVGSSSSSTVIASSIGRKLSSLETNSKNQNESTGSYHTTLTKASSHKTQSQQLIPSRAVISCSQTQIPEFNDKKEEFQGSNINITNPFSNPQFQQQLLQPTFSSPRQHQYQSQKLEQQQLPSSQNQLPSESFVNKSRIQRKSKLFVQPNFVEIVQLKNQRSSSLSQLINRQNRPIGDALEKLSQQGFDIIKLSRLTFDELKNLTRNLGNPKSQQKNLNQPSKSAQVISQTQQSIPNIQTKSDLGNILIPFNKVDNSNCWQSTPPSLIHIPMINQNQSSKYPKEQEHRDSLESESQREYVSPTDVTCSRKEQKNITSNRYSTEIASVDQNSCNNKINNIQAVCMNSPSTISLPIRKVLMNTLENGTGTTTTTVGANISNLQLKYPSTAMNKKSVNMYPGNLNNFESFSAKDLLASSKPKTTMNSTSSNFLYSSIQQKMLDSPRVDSSNLITISTPLIKEPKDFTSLTTGKVDKLNLFQSPNMNQNLKSSRMLFKGSTVNNDKHLEKQLYKFEENFKPARMPSESKLKDNSDLLLISNKFCPKNTTNISSSTYDSNTTTNHASNNSNNPSSTTGSHNNTCNYLGSTSTTCFLRTRKEQIRNSLAKAPTSFAPNTENIFIKATNFTKPTKNLLA